MRKVISFIEFVDAEYGTRDPEKIAAMENIFCLVWKLPRCVQGFSFAYDGDKYIVINEKVSEKGRQFVLLHELYHLLNSHTNEYNRLIFMTNAFIKTTREELEADYFAFICMNYDDLENINPLAIENEIAIFKRRHLKI
ncbi:ImmA/IrrE family metallo-endopeptidase [Caldicellulosiruptor bescii]|uniref:ImmA/IrrE family metallo-endopeptidase n=1 Tax=Caldicellulosiruptor bescii TaxID=31899 RepID=UPI002093F375|nr:ImmA/IrrE family metallo-endopeptidase [Caldicellulosiruptor bescii]